MVMQSVEDIRKVSVMDSQSARLNINEPHVIFFFYADLN